MKKINIAVLDDFIDTDIYSKKNTELKQTHIIKDNKKNKIVPNHGERVIATINKYSNEKKVYYKYNVFNYGKPSDRVIEVLKDLLELPIDLIVMSFTIKNEKCRKKIHNLCKALTEKNKIIVAADSNDFKRNSFPATFNSVIGTGHTLCKKNNIIWTGKSDIQVLANVAPEFVCVQSKFWVFNGTSKANAIVASTICQIIVKGITGYEDVLAEIKRRCKDNTIEILKESLKEECCSNINLNKIIVSMLQEKGYKDINQKQNVNLPNITNSIYELENLILMLSERLKINLSDKEFGFTDFNTSYALVNYLELKTHDKKEK